MTKRLISLVLALLMVFSVVASASTDAEPEEKPEWKIAVVPKMTTIAWFERMEKGVEMYNEEFDDDIFYGGSTDGAGQAAYVESLLAEDYDAICVTPFDTEAMEPILEKAREQGIIVITHEASSMTNIDYDVEAFDNVAIGAAIMDKIAEKVNEEGEYIQLVGALTSKTHMEWTEGAEERQKEEYPDMTMVGKLETKDSQDEAYNKVKEALTDNPNIAAIQCSASTDMAGASRAVEELGLTGKVVILGISIYSVSGRYVEEGIASGFFFWDSAMAAMAQIEVAKAVLEDRFDELIEEGIQDPFIKGYDELVLEDKVIYANSYVYLDQENIAENEEFHY
ncbi:MAG TPA: substrate-binding domain-containing protein [Clostridiaceae bacterium]|nr:substrate-binding domain-containing protein [Clostridiaceae bacterium]